MKYLFSILILLISFQAFSQKEKTIDALLKAYNTRSIPYISVEELKMDAHRYQILDTRKKTEYLVSHIPGAIWVGEHYDPSTTFIMQKDGVLEPVNLDKSKPVVVYCSLGIRSEKFGEQLLNAGFKNVQNVYGSIFAWKDKNYPIVDSLNNVTNKVHVYSKVWRKYLQTGEKIW